MQQRILQPKIDSLISVTHPLHRGFFIAIILKIAKFAENNYEKISEVDINPLIVCKKGKGVFAVDALIHYFK